MFLCSKKAKNPSPKSSQTGFLGPGPVTGFVTDLLPNRGRNAEKMGTLKVTGLALYNFTNHPNSLLSRLLACYSGGGGGSRTPVRKKDQPSLSERSLCFAFRPQAAHRQATLRLSLCVSPEGPQGERLPEYPY